MNKKDEESIGIELIEDIEDILKRNEKTSIETEGIEEVEEGKVEEEEIEEEAHIKIEEEKKVKDKKKETVKEKKEIKKKEKVRLLKKKIFAIISVLVLIIAFSSYIYDNKKKELLIVKIPTERIGDKATYDVSSQIKTTEKNGISTPWVEIRSINITFSGPLIIQTNETTKKEDGFGEIHNVIDKFIHQNLEIDGKVEFEKGLKVTVEPEGNIETKESIYTDLKTNTTVQRKISNDVNVYGGVGELIIKDDIRYYTQSNDYLTYIMEFLDIGKVIPENRAIKEGEEYTSKNGNNTFKWKAEGVDTVYGKKALRINVTVENFLTTHNFSSFIVLIWIANDISLPVKFFVKGNIDLSELSQSPIEFYYKATMTDYNRGKKIIPYGNCNGKHFYKKRPGYDKEFIKSDNWEYVPPIGDMSTSLDKNFTGENASEFAYNHTELKNYYGLHKSSNPFVIQAYYNESLNKTWNLTFGYKNKRQEDIYVDGYNVIVTKNSNNTIANGKVVESIREPLIEKKNIKESLSFSGAEQIFKSDKEIKKKAFLNNKIDLKNVNFGIKVNEMPTPKLVGFDISPLNSFELLGGYNFYLEKKTETIESLELFKTSLDGQNGQLLYVINHYQKIGSSIF